MSDRVRKIAYLMTTPDLRADIGIVKKSAQALVDGIDGMLWAAQSMPEADGLRKQLAGCKANLKVVLETLGYTLKVKGGFKTTVTKVRQPRKPAVDDLEKQWEQSAVEPRRPAVDDLEKQWEQPAVGRRHRRPALMRSFKYHAASRICA